MQPSLFPPAQSESLARETAARFWSAGPPSRFPRQLRELLDDQGVLLHGSGANSAVQSWAAAQHSKTCRQIRSRCGGAAQQNRLSASFRAFCSSATHCLKQEGTKETEEEFGAGEVMFRRVAEIVRQIGGVAAEALAQPGEAELRGYAFQAGAWEREQKVN